MSADSDIQMGSVLPNDHGEGHKGECPCIGTECQIFERVDRGCTVFEISEVRNGCSETAAAGTVGKGEGWEKEGGVGAAAISVI